MSPYNSVDLQALGARVGFVQSWKFSCIDMRSHNGRLSNLRIQEKHKILVILRTKPCFTKSKNSSLYKKDKIMKEKSFAA